MAFHASFENGCQYKHRHETRLAAMQQAAHGKTKTHGGKRRLDVYHCPFCNGWHVGRRPGRRESKRLDPYPRDKRHQRRTAIKKW